MDGRSLTNPEFQSTEKRRDFWLLVVHANQNSGTCRLPNGGCTLRKRLFSA
jgi:hypothetical protein